MSKKNWVERFEQKIEKCGSDECWRWTAATASGYGVLRIDGRNYNAHRLAFQLAFGPIPRGCFVCHTCDSRYCVNPNHLFLGTNQDNQNDNVKKGRANNLIGELHPKAKLTASQVEGIRLLYDNDVQQYVLAKQYGVAFSSIANIVHNKTWVTA